MNPAANLTALTRLCAFAATPDGMDKLAGLDPDAIARKFGAEPMLVRIVVGFICPDNPECLIAESS